MRPALTHLGDAAAGRSDLEMAAILCGAANGLAELRLLRWHRDAITGLWR